MNGRGWEIKAKGSIQIEQKGIRKQAGKDGKQEIMTEEEREEEIKNVREGGTTVQKGKGERKREGERQ